jgi:hypothetical protein
MFQSIVALRIRAIALRLKTRGELMPSDLGELFGKNFDFSMSTGLKKGT